MIQFQLNIDEYYLCHQSFVELAFRHCLRLSGLKFTKNHYWLFLVPPYSLQKLIWDGSGLVGMRAHPPCIAGVPFKLISYDLVLFCRL